MKALRENTVTFVWLLLTLITCFSWMLGTGQIKAGLVSHAEASLGIIVLAFFKVRLVILHFMEVRTAPLVLRAVCELWIALVCATVVIFYLSGPHAA